MKNISSYRGRDLRLFTRLVTAAECDAGRFMWKRLLHCAHHIYSGVPALRRDFTIKQVEVCFQEFFHVDGETRATEEERLMQIEVNPD